MKNKNIESLELVKKSIESDNFSLISENNISGKVCEEKARFELDYGDIDRVLLSVQGNEEFNISGSGYFLDVSFKNHLNNSGKAYMESVLDTANTFDAPVRRKGVNLVDSFSNYIDGTILKLSKESNLNGDMSISSGLFLNSPKPIPNN